jgi:hypothetical protein
VLKMLHRLALHRHLTVKISRGMLNPRRPPPDPLHTGCIPDSHIFNLMAVPVGITRRRTNRDGKLVETISSPHTVGEEAQLRQCSLQCSIQCNIGTNHRPINSSIRDNQIGNRDLLAGAIPDFAVLGNPLSPEPVPL